MAGFGPDFASVKDSDLLRGIYIGPEKIDTCAIPARPGSLARSRKQRQRGGACGCLRPRSRKQRGGMYMIKKTKNKKLNKKLKKSVKKQKQHGGAGYTFAIAPAGLDLKTSDMPLGKMPEVVTTPCPKPLPGFYPQIGGGALVGSEIAATAAPLAGTTQLVNPALYDSTPAGVQFKLGQTSVFGPEKIPYPQVDSITSRSLCSAPMTRRRGRNRKNRNN
jgi:hypothetical protein